MWINGNKIKKKQTKKKEVMIKSSMLLCVESGGDTRVRRMRYDVNIYNMMNNVI